MAPIKATVKNNRLQLDVPADWPDGTQVEIHPLANQANGAGADDEWTEAKNARRYDLIDRRIQGSITSAEQWELDRLQRQAIAERDRNAPLPIDGARRLHEQLLAAKRKHDEASS